MKGTLIFTAFVLLLSQAFAGITVPSSKNAGAFLTKGVIRSTGSAQSVGFDKCKTCVDFAGDALNQLLNIIIRECKGGVVGVCADLCGALASKTSPAVGTMCNLLCDIVGIEKFIKITEKADLDTIYFCELIPACPINDNGDAKFTTFQISPQSGPQGDFSIDLEYSSMNGTGTGMIALEIVTVDHIPLQQDFLDELAPAGTYTGQFKLKAVPDPDFDPSQGPCEEWLPGAYTVKIAICNGEYESKHPHSQIYDQKTASFTITP